MSLRSSLKNIIPQPLKVLRRLLMAFSKDAAQLGLVTAFQVHYRKVCPWLPPIRPDLGRDIRRILLPGYRHQLYLRQGASDLDVITQVFHRK